MYTGVRARERQDKTRRALWQKAAALLSALPGPLPMQDARMARDNDAIKRAITEYDEALEAYIPGGSMAGPLPSS